MKEDVEKSLAPKEETIIEVELTQLQKKFYRGVLERNFDNLIRGGKANNLPSLMNVMMQLRKCCNHPYLLQGVEESELQGITDPQQVHALLIAASGKLVLIDKLLPRLKQAPFSFPLPLPALSHDHHRIGGSQGAHLLSDGARA